MIRRETFVASYQKRTQDMSVSERIAYCSGFIFRTHQFLSTHHISRYARNRALALLMTAEYELTQLLHK